MADCLEPLWVFIFIVISEYNAHCISCSFFSTGKREFWFKNTIWRCVFFLLRKWCWLYMETVYAHFVLQTNSLYYILVDNARCTFLSSPFVSSIHLGSSNFTLSWIFKSCLEFAWQQFLIQVGGFFLMERANSANKKPLQKKKNWRNKKKKPSTFTSTPSSITWTLDTISQQANILHTSLLILSVNFILHSH